MIKKNLGKYGRICNSWLGVRVRVCVCARVRVCGVQGTNSRN